MEDKYFDEPNKCPMMFSAKPHTNDQAQLTFITKIRVRKYHLPTCYVPRVTIYLASFIPRPIRKIWLD